MKRKYTIFAVIFAVSILIGIQAVEVADANPTWGTSATPIPPITDPPQIIITSPNSIEYDNPVPLNITIIQPDSWISKTNMHYLPNSYVDNSDSVVVGQNKLKSITCIIDGQSIILWNGTPIGSSAVNNAVTYYMPRITQFSAIMNLSKGQHNLQVNVIAVSDYVTEGIIPFAQKEYIISANQSTTFRVEDGSDAPMIYNIKSSYLIWNASSASMPSSTIAPPQSLSPVPTSSPIPTSAPSLTASQSTPSPSPSSIPTSTPSVPEFSWLTILPILLAIPIVLVIIRKTVSRNITLQN